jgi:hypothetical protein
VNRYYKEWNAQFDYFHHTEGMSAFTLQGLAEPYDPKFIQRTKTYSAMYAFKSIDLAPKRCCCHMLDLQLIWQNEVWISLAG